jgi:hypothetical protein
MILVLVLVVQGKNTNTVTEKKVKNIPIVILSKAKEALSWERGLIELLMSP